jgi:hypothetical protein
MPSRPIPNGTKRAETEKNGAIVAKVENSICSRPPLGGQVIFTTEAQRTRRRRNYFLCVLRVSVVINP